MIICLYSRLLLLCEWWGGGHIAACFLSNFNTFCLYARKSCHSECKYISGDRHPALSRTFTAGRQSWRGRGRGRKRKREGRCSWVEWGGAQRQFSIFASPPLHHTALVIASCWLRSNLASLVPAVSRQPDLRP